MLCALPDTWMRALFEWAVRARLGLFRGPLFDPPSPSLSQSAERASGPTVIPQTPSTSSATPQTQPLSVRDVLRFLNFFFSSLHLCILPISSEYLYACVEQLTSSGAVREAASESQSQSVDSLGAMGPVLAERLVRLPRELLFVPPLRFSLVEFYYKFAGLFPQLNGMLHVAHCTLYMYTRFAHLNAVCAARVQGCRSRGGSWRSSTAPTPTGSSVLVFSATFSLPMYSSRLFTFSSYTVYTLELFLYLYRSAHSHSHALLAAREDAALRSHCRVSRN